MKQEKGKELIKVALLDLWKATGNNPLAPSVVDEALSKWEADELLEFLDRSSKFISSDFTITLDRSSVWRVTHLNIEERDSNLKVALYKQLQNHLTDRAVSEAFLEGIDRKYLDFFNPLYGGDPDEDLDEL